MASKVSDADAKRALEMHNIERRAIYPDTNQYPDLVWSDRLARNAQKWAEHMARTESFGHSNVHSHGEGENIYMSTGGNRSAADATATFINEKRRVRAGARGFTVGRENEVAGGVIGHWTQILYGPLRKLGIGMARSRSGAVYICARYDKIQMGGTKVKFPSGWNAGMGWTGSSRGNSGGGSGGGHGQNPFRNPLSPNGGGSGGGNERPQGLNNLLQQAQQEQFPGWNVNHNQNPHAGNHGQHHHHRHDHNRHHGQHQHQHQRQPTQGSGILNSLLRNMGLNVAQPKVAGDNMVEQLIGLGVKKKHAKKVEEVINQKRGGRGHGSGSGSGKTGMNGKGRKGKEWK